MFMCNQQENDKKRRGCTQMAKMNRHEKRVCEICVELVCLKNYLMDATKYGPVWRKTGMFRRDLTYG